MRFWSRVGTRTGTLPSGGLYTMSSCSLCASSTLTASVRSLAPGSSRTSPRSSLDERANSVVERQVVSEADGTTRLGFKMTCPKCDLNV